jgi:hypothetical protein
MYRFVDVRIELAYATAGAALPKPPIKIKTAFEELLNKHELLTCRIEKIDPILKLTGGDRLAVIGNKKYSQMFVTRLCVNALLSSSSPSSLRKNNSKLVASSRFHTSNVILVDAGNSIDFYQYVNFARQYYRRDVVSRILNNTIVTRPFTVYQLEDIVINQLPNVIQQYDAKMVVVSDLLNMFVRDPQIGANEARHLINEIVNSITKLSALEDVLVVVSLPYEYGVCHHHSNKPFMPYNKTVFPRFDKCIEIMNGKDKKKNRMIDITIRNSNNMRRINNFHNGKLLSINKRDLLTLSAPAR